MIPIVILTAEQALRMVPSKMKAAAVGMGCTKAQVTWKIVVPTAFPGILTGVMLAIARAAGETAPLIFTAMMANHCHFPIGRPIPPFLFILMQTDRIHGDVYSSSMALQARPTISSNWLGLHPWYSC